MGTFLGQEQLKNTVLDNYIGPMAWYDQPIDQIRPLRPLVWPSVASHLTTLIIRSRTVQSPGSCPETLQVTGYNWQVDSFGSLTLCRSIVSVFYNPSYWTLPMKKMQHDAIYSSRNLKTTRCTAWHSRQRRLHEDFTAFCCHSKDGTKNLKELNMSSGDYEGKIA